VYGVTGTNGKTTTTYFLNAVLAALGHTTGLIGTIETRIAGTSLASEFTTPEAPALHSLLACMREAEVTAASMEVSSHAMAYKRTYGLLYGVVGFTNLTQDHLDLHGSMAAYFDAKATLFTDDHSTVRVVTLNGGAEPHWGHQLATQVPNAITLDLGPAAASEGSTAVRGHWTITKYEPSGLGHTFTLHHESGFTVTTRVGMPGKFNIANAALAAVMVFAGHEQHHWEHIKAVLERRHHAPFESAVPGRMEVIAETPTVVVDYAHNPDGLTQALQAVNRSSRQQHGAQGRTIVVFGATGQRDTAKRPLMGRIAAEHADVVIITDDDPHHEDPVAIRQAVLVGARQIAKGSPDGPEVLEIVPRADALAYAVELARPTDTILAAGRGHETQQDFAGVVFPIDDRKVLQQALRDHGFVTSGSASPQRAD
jgi:UDP-N-acetylmuramoyl-L-alanyl-D-glutamate--2,6-diaminopimelate ligase